MSEKREEGPIGGKLMAGSVWMIAMRALFRLLGFINVAVLARLLIPDDFGLVAMSMIIVGFIMIFREIGTVLAVIRNPNATRDHYDTAWTLGIIMGAIVSLALFVAAPLGTVFFDDPRIETIIRVLAVAPFIKSLENIGVADFRKELKYGKEFRYILTARVFSVTVTIVLAIIFRNYWALVIGTLAGSLLRVCLSYYMSDYRPRLSLAAVDELWSFSTSVVILGLGAFCVRRADQFMVGSVYGSDSMGEYFLSFDVSQIIVLGVVLPLNRALLPGYAKMSHARDRLARAYVNVLGFVAMIAILVGFGLSAVASDFILVALGSKWLQISGLLQIAAISNTCLAIAASNRPIFVAINKMHVLAILAWCHFAGLAMALVLLGKDGTLMQIATVRAVVSVTFLVVSIYVTGRNVRVGFRQLAKTFVRPLIAGVVMVLSIPYFHFQGIEFAVIRLAIDATSGALVFVITIIGLWWLTGKKDGIEKELISRLPQSIGKRLPLGWYR